ncbi:MAG: hypothetical protein NT120_03355 [Candidatus Aenigmarchaeota archaeon]|nr:hypothetical protein [Candidatus Aenigmarchaeota archaeon]
MPEKSKLVLVEGITGSGKSAVCRYMKDLGYSKCSAGTQLVEMGAPSGLDYNMVRWAMPSNGSIPWFWPQFSMILGHADYSIEDAQEIIKKHANALRRYDTSGLTNDECFVLGYVTWNELLKRRNAMLEEGKNIVIESVIDRDVSSLLLGRTDAEEYLIRMHVDRNVAVKRKMHNDWPKEIARKMLFERKYDFYSPQDIVPKAVLVEYRYNSYRDKLLIQEDLRRRFGRK